MPISITGGSDIDVSSLKTGGFTGRVLLSSGKVEAIEVHDLVPAGYEVFDEFLLRVFVSVDLGDGSKLRVRTEDEVDDGGVHLMSSVTRSRPS